MSTEDTLKHLQAGDLTAAKVTEAPRHNSATGYGPKIPTGYMLQSGGKWRRVYVAQYGNSGSAYVLIGGESHYLSPGVELILETVRDGGTFEAALELMSAWPEWMKAAEKLPVPEAPDEVTVTALELQRGDVIYGTRENGKSAGGTLTVENVYFSGGRVEVHTRTGTLEFAGADTVTIAPRATR